MGGTIPQVLHSIRKPAEHEPMSQPVSAVSPWFLLQALAAVLALTFPSDGLLP